MKVKELMTHDVFTCPAQESLASAARIMWEHDCGALPVVDEHQHLIGMLTDRDICMAAYIQGKPLSGLTAGVPMAPSVFSAQPDDSIETIEKLMRTHQVRRVPVVDSEKRVVGMVSLNDIAREAEREDKQGRRREVTLEGVARTLARICEPRPHGPIATP